MIHLIKGVGREAVEKVKLRTPARAGRNWKGVAHADTLKAMADAMKFVGWTAKGPALYALSPNKLVMAAAFQVTHKNLPKMPRNFAPMIGVMAGNDRHTPLTVFAGFRNFQAGNDQTNYAAVLESVKAPGANTKHAEVAGRLEAAMDELSPELMAMPARVFHLSEIPSSYTDMATELCSAAQKKLFPWSYIRAGVTQWTRQYAKPATERSRLAVYHCFWECLRFTNPVTHLTAGCKFTSE